MTSAEKLRRVFQLEMRYCPLCGGWVKVDERQRCIICNSFTYGVRNITDPEEVRELVKVRPEHREYEEEIIKMIAVSGALLEGHFRLGPDDS